MNNTLARRIGSLLPVMAAAIMVTGCIDFYKAAPEEAMRTFLVIDGDITDDTTVIYLRQSVPISNYQLDVTGFPKVNDARVRVERSDGVFFDAIENVDEGKYKIATGDLDPDLEYRLKVEHGGNTYLSAYAFPLRTPEIDEVRISYNDSADRFDEFNVYVSVALSNPNDGSPYYKWQCDEIYEYHVLYRVPGVDPPYYCWKYATTYHHGNFEKFAGGSYFKTLMPVSTLGFQLSSLYYLKITQLRITREANDYYGSMFKNSKDMGTVFSPIPSEVNGNIRCENNPDIPVIGYISVSKTTFTELFIPYPNEYYYYIGDSFFDYCSACSEGICADLDVCGICAGCSDCRVFGGIRRRPEWWPNDHY